MFDIHTCPHLVQSNENVGVTVLAGFWEAGLSPVLPCLRTLNLRNLLFSFLLSVFSESFFDDFRHCNVSPSEEKCLQRSVNSSTPVLSV